MKTPFAAVIHIGNDLPVADESEHKIIIPIRYPAVMVSDRIVFSCRDAPLVSTPLLFWEGSKILLPA